MTKVCTPKMIEQFRSIDSVSEEIRRKEQELSEWTKNQDSTPGSIHTSRLTNIGVFCKYVEDYLALREELHPAETMTCLVRQLPPTETGLPIEIYAFCRETSLKKFEAIQGDIFDHILSSLPDFDLRPFQALSAFSTSAHPSPLHA